MKKHMVRAWAIGVMMLLLICAFSAATYAWFTSNKLVKTDTAQIRSGTESLTLEISSSADGAYSQEAAITQLNTARVLNPVSTSDLKTFYKSVIMEKNQAVSFTQTEDGYYHGQVFLRAAAEGMPETSVLTLYLDTGGVAVTDTETPGLLLNAARVGLVFTTNGAQSAPIILSLSSLHIDGNKSNTVIPNAPDGDFVLNGANSAVADPAVISADYTITENGGTIELAKKSLTELPLNKVCTVDVYFYIEGCDRDCTNEIRSTEMSIQLPFYGVLTEKGGA